MQLVFRSLILLIAMITYGHADKVATVEVAKADSEQAEKATVKGEKVAPGEATKVASEKVDKNATGKADKPKLISKPLPEMSMGSSKAPVVIIVYSSLTCKHCADFHTSVLPAIEEKYISPGYVRISFRDYPGDQISLKAHQIAWSKGEMKYLDFVKLIYSTQEKWLSAPDPVAALKSIALQNGITAKQFESCLKDQELLDKIIQLRLDGQKKYNITATPTIIINAKIYPEALSLEEFEKIVSPLLALTFEKEKEKKIAKEEKEEKKEKKEDIIKVNGEKKEKEKTSEP